MLNSVVLIGRLTKDPELRYTQSGIAVANFTLAVDRQFKSQDGEKETDFIRIIVWRKQAENVANFIGKGRLVAVEGRLQISKYKDKNGQNRQSAEVVAENVRFLDKGKQAENTVSATTEKDYDDDLPF